jgi:hypothetical protein
MLKIIRLLGLVWLLFVIFFGWGFLASRYQLFPSDSIVPLLNEIEAFVTGDVHENSNLADKIISEVTKLPNRYTNPYNLNLNTSGLERYQFGPTRRIHDYCPVSGHQGAGKKKLEIPLCKQA